MGLWASYLSRLLLFLSKFFPSPNLKALVKMIILLIFKCCSQKSRANDKYINIFTNNYFPINMAAFTLTEYIYNFFLLRISRFFSSVHLKRSVV